MNGLTLLAPAGLFALAALAIPLLIHLFSRSRGRRVRVGNIALYRQAQRQRVTQLKLVQWLLLLLRLLLLALAALLLAGLARKGLDTLPGTTAYVTPAWLARTGDATATLASFDAAFVLGTDSRGHSGIEALGAGDPWSLLAERLASVRHTGEVHVFALGVAGQFPAAAPPLGDDLVWHLDGETVDPAPLPALAISLVSAPGREQDAVTLGLALDALATHRSVRLEVTRGSTEAPLAPRRSDDDRQTMIWLGNDPAPRSAVAAWGPGTWLEDRRPDELAAPTEARLPRFPQLEFPTRSGAETGTLGEDDTVLWWTGDGRPLLRQATLGETRHLVFEDRLGADGLTASPAFPDILLRLLLGETEWSAGLGHAPADPTAALGATRPAGGGPDRPLGPWLALAIAVLFMLERWLSERGSRGRREDRAT